MLKPGPCPKCGAEPLVMDTDSYWYILCNSRCFDNTSATYATGQTWEAVVRDWNERVRATQPAH